MCCTLIAAGKWDIIQVTVSLLLNSLKLFPFILAQSLHTVDTLEPPVPWHLSSVASCMHLKYTGQL